MEARWQSSPPATVIMSAEELSLIHNPAAVHRESSRAGDAKSSSSSPIHFDCPRCKIDEDPPRCLYRLHGWSELFMCYVCERSPDCPPADALAGGRRCTRGERCRERREANQSSERREGGEDGS